jgi:hypothetical protein
MAQKFLYLVDHFESFPRSEYGGIWNVIAKNNDECFDLIKDYDNGFNENYVNLRENVIKAERFALAENKESRIVTSFTT